MKSSIYRIVMALQPDMKDCADNANFQHWIDYGYTLDEVLYIVDLEGPESMVKYINNVLKNKLSTSPEHHACTDVASTLESLYVDRFAGKFKY